MKVEIVCVSIDIFPRGGSFLVSLPDNATAGTLLRYLEEKEVGERSYRLATEGHWNVLAVLDGRVIGPEHVLKDGDKVQLFPSMTGG